MTVSAKRITLLLLALLFWAGQISFAQNKKDLEQKKAKIHKEIDFTKSKTGLGDIYGEELKNKLMNSNPEAFLEAELAGPDAPLKREIEEIAKDLF